MNLSAHQKAVTALVVANIIWGAAFPIFKWSLQNVHPFTLAFLRFYVAILILFPIAHNHLHVKKEDILKVILYGFFGISVNIGALFIGLTMTKSINAPIIAAADPIFLLAISFFFFHEKLKKRLLFGTLMSFIGVLYIVLQPIAIEGFDGQLAGNLFLLAGTLGTVLHTTVLKTIKNEYHTYTLTFWSFMVGMICFLPGFAQETLTYGFLPDLNIQGIVGIIFGAVLSSTVAYLAFDYAVRNIQTSEVGIFIYISPIVTILIAIPLLGEVLTLPFIIGTAIVFAGIFLSEGRRIALHVRHSKKV